MSPAGAIDTREFTAALREYQKATKKDEAEILNRAGGNMAFRAAQFTPFAGEGKIRASLRRNKLAIKILSKSPRRRFKGIPVSRRGAIVTDFILRRVRSSKYIRAGWAKALKAFGRNASRLHVRAGSKADRGYGQKATAWRMVAELGNDARGADTVGLEPLQRAVDFVARDMLAYARRRTVRTAQRFSAKGVR